MRKFMAIAVLVSGGYGVAFASPILVNPGFETGSLSPWFANSGTPTITTAQAHTGTYSVAAFSNDEIRQNFAPVPTSSINEVSFWVMRNGGPFDQYTLYYSDGSSEDLLVSGSGNGWVFFNVTSQLDAGKSLNGFSIFGTTSGPAYLDDFNIDADVAPVPEPVSLLVFGGLVLGGGWVARKRLMKKVA